MKTDNKIDRFCQQQSWPEDKPIANIVFPRVLQYGRITIPTLWAMLPEADLENLRTCRLYQKITLLDSPRAIPLWMIAFYTRERTHKWFPCYLNLETPVWRDMVKQLEKRGMYRILFFTREHSEQCDRVRMTAITPSQCQRLKEWINASQGIKSSTARSSQKLLLREFRQLKPQIVAKLGGLDFDTLLAV